MRYASLTLALLLVACTTKEQKPVAVKVVGPRAAVALYGDWVQIAPASLRGDTLTLRADSTARGLIRWDEGRMATITHWKLAFGSKDAVASREDWRAGHGDGGDMECSMAASGPRALEHMKAQMRSAGTSAADIEKRFGGCVSMPLLCLGASAEYQCQVFLYAAPDSLALQDGSRYVRAARLASVGRGIDSNTRN